VTAISEILAGKRRGLPRPEWVASFVLACQYLAARAEPGRRDQGLAILRYWTAIHAAHTPAADGPPAAWQLTAAQRAFFAGHGPHSQILITRAENGHPHARYRAALLLATDPSRIDQAAELLTELASTGYPPALDLLAILARSKRIPADPEPAGQPASPAAREIEAAHPAAEHQRTGGNRPG